MSFESFHKQILEELLSSVADGVLAGSQVVKNLKECIKHYEMANMKTEVLLCQTILESYEQIQVNMRKIENAIKEYFEIRGWKP